jgi:2-polyprenyl-6-methoxyphenol hydroxylase-like FAD-dependent oxidoreductase
MPATNPTLIPKPDEIPVEHAQVIIVGAGPVGLFLALKLAQAGIDILVLEAERQILQSPRATT